MADEILVNIVTQVFQEMHTNLELVANILVFSVFLTPSSPSVPVPALHVVLSLILVFLSYLKRQAEYNK